ncbi:MAG: hypothetical protein ACHQ50_02720 [Fimbriimonadales bacterium]
MDELRAKDLAAIEPPGSISKIVQFAEQLSFGQEALFAGAELPVPKIGTAGFGSRAMSQKIAERPYSFFPGANGEGLDTLMSRYTIRSRDIQDFTRWLMRWDDKRTQFLVKETPDQFFLRRATPQMIEAFEASPEVQRVVVEGRRRRRVVEEHVHETEIEERVRKVQRTKEIRTIDEESAEASPRRGRFRGHPRAEAGEPDYGEYWREQPSAKAAAVVGGGRMASAAAAAPFDPGMLVSSLNRGIVTSNVGFGSTAFGVIRGREDVTAQYQAQEAAASAVQSSPVAPYIPQQAPVFHYPPPEVYVQQARGARPIQVTTDWEGAPQFQKRASGTARSGRVQAKLPEDYVLVSRDVAETSGIDAATGVRRPSTGLMRGVGVAALAGGMAEPALGFGGVSEPASNVSQLGAEMAMGGQATGPVSFAGSSQMSGTPGASGTASQAFAGQVATRVIAGAPGQAVFPGGFFGAGANATAMPAGSIPRKNLYDMSWMRGAEGQAIGEFGQNAEGQVRAGPTNPLMGRITVVSPPIQVASQASERAGTAVAFDIKNLAKGAGALDAAGLAMLKSALPPGAQAIYPALPPGSLGPQAVNMPLAPSLLSQILTEGYGPQAGAMAGGLASAGSGISMPSGGGALDASIVPTAQRPTDATAGLFGQQDAQGPGSLQHAGAANASRGGALDFLGMPVRLAPSLAGDSDVKQAAEARKVLPAGAAAIMRPNEFGAMRTKLFPGISTVHAEPDKSAWQHAAPSFGLRDAEPHTLLSPDARIKPPHASASLPQMHEGGDSHLSKALHAATVIAPAASAALGPGAHTPGGAIVDRAAHAAAGMAMPRVGAPDIRFPHAHPGTGAGMGLGDVRFATPSMMPRGRLIPRTGGISMPGVPSSPRIHLPAGAAAASAGSSRVASRFSLPHRSIGAGPSATVHAGGGASDHHVGMPREHASSLGHRGGSLPMSLPGGGHAPQMASVLPSPSPAIPSTTGFSSSTAPMTMPAMPATTGGHSSTPSLGAPSGSGYGPPATPGMPVPSMSSSSLSLRAPDMTIATSVPARPPQQTAMIQRATASGGAVHANRSDHAPDSHGDQTNSQAQDPGASAHDVNLLANEVWSLLKRKLLFESERLGKRY